jgi:uncharacterized protein
MYLYVCYIIIAIIIEIAIFSKLKVRKYIIKTNKVNDDIKIIQISDLHGCYYGIKQKYLIDKIKNEKPDLIVYTGDIFDDRWDNEATINLLKETHYIAPCYFVIGNHEYHSNDTDEIIDIIKKCNIKILSQSNEIIKIKNSKINLYGLDDPLKNKNEKHPMKISKEHPYLDSIKPLNLHMFNVLLTHRPEMFKHYASKGFDTIIAGHAHGGQVRIPFILKNGLFAPNQGIFPKYTGGMYKYNNSIMIVSTGLSNYESVPRIFNRPELVVINIKKD